MITFACWVIRSHRTLFWAPVWSDAILLFPSYAENVHKSDVWSVKVKYWFPHLYSHYPVSPAAQLNLLDYWFLVCRGHLQSALIKGSSVSSRLTAERWITDIIINFMWHNRGFMMLGRKRRLALLSEWTIDHNYSKVIMMWLYLTVWVITGY